MSGMLEQVEHAAESALGASFGVADKGVTAWWRDLNYLAGVAKIVITVLLVLGLVVVLAILHDVPAVLGGLIGVAMNSLFRDHSDAATANRTAAAILTTAPPALPATPAPWTPPPPPAPYQPPGVSA